MLNILKLLPGYQFCNKNIKPSLTAQYFLSNIFLIMKNTQMLEPEGVNGLLADVISPCRERYFTAKAEQKD